MSMNYSFIFISVVLFIFPSLVMANNALTEDAKKCTSINARLERLDCFDKVFNTKLPQVEPRQAIKSEAWYRGMALENKRVENNLRPLISDAIDNSNDIWLTLPSLSDSNTQGVLMLSCIDNISRLDLLLKEKISQVRLEISANAFKTSLWRVDNSGYVLSSARGLPAIELIKDISNFPMLKIESEDAVINGMSFNTRDLSTSLTSLRRNCRW